MGLLTTMKGIPLAYNKDMQEDKEGTFDAIDTAKSCLILFTGMVRTMRLKRKPWKEAHPAALPTPRTRRTIWWRRAFLPRRHGVIGRLVLYCIEKGKSIGELSIEEFKSFSPAFEEDVYDAVSLKTCVEKRLTLGAPGRAAMEQVIALNRKYLLENEAIAAEKEE